MINLDPLFKHVWHKSHDICFPDCFGQTIDLHELEEHLKNITHSSEKLDESN